MKKGDIETFTRQKIFFLFPFATFKDFVSFVRGNIVESNKIILKIVMMVIFYIFILSVVDLAVLNKQFY